MDTFFGIRKRKGEKASNDPNITIDHEDHEDFHPSGQAQHGQLEQTLRFLLFATYFIGSCVVIATTQLFGAPLYFVSKPWYYTYMARTKASFGLLITTMTQWWSPTLIRISGDNTVANEIKQTTDGRVECSFPTRLVLIANHQLYFDWLYLWWISYTNQPAMHGHLYIILKESLKYVPVIGTGMMFFGFIFMSRKMDKDQPRLAYRLNKLKTKEESLSKTAQIAAKNHGGLDPMWLLVFPEGTNLSDNGRANSAKWAKKIGVEDLRHQLLPRSTGSFFILNQLKGTVHYIYDCTLAYEGIPRGKYGQDYFTLKTAYLEGRPPKSVNMYWRKIALKDVPLDDAKEFEQWMDKQWRLKDKLLETYMVEGKFPGCEAGLAIAQRGNKKQAREQWIETEVKPKSWWECGNIFVVLATIGLIANILAKCYNVAVYGRMSGWTA